MSLSDYDEDYDSAKAEDAVNDFPDGEYELVVTGAKPGLILGKTFNTDKISFFFKVHDGDYMGFPARCEFVFGSRADIAAKQLKYLMEAMKLPARPSAFDSEAFCRCLVGYVLTAKKSTTAATNGRQYTNWGYWHLVSKPEGSDNDGSEYDTPPTPPADTKKPVGEEIDLGNDPF